MINKVELGSVQKRNITPKYDGNHMGQASPSFTGNPLLKAAGDTFFKLIETCEKKPMVNVAVIDLSTAIIPRTIFETVIGSKQTDENGNQKKRRFNIMAGFEAFRREFSGLLINCMIPGVVVMGLSKYLLNKPIMGKYSKSGFATSWANGEAINKVNSYYNAAEGATKNEKMYNALKNMLFDIEGVDGDVSKGGLKSFKELLQNDAEVEKALKNAVENIVSEEPKKNFAKELYNAIVKKTGIAENIRFKGEKGFSSSNLGHICESASDILHAISKEGVKEGHEIPELLKRAKGLVNAKSLGGLAIIIPLAIAAQPINRWITHKMSGKKGAPIYNDDKDRVLTPEEKKDLTKRKFLAIPSMLGVTALSMLMDRPSKGMLQFKNIFPTMDQARIVSASTFSSRLASAEDTTELKENTIRDIITFCSLYFLGDYAAKAAASLIEKRHDDVHLINRLKESKSDEHLLQKFWNWAKNSKLKSSDELEAITNSALKAKNKKFRMICQVANLAFSLLVLGVFVPIYTRTKSNKHERERLEKEMQKGSDVTFTNNLLRNQTKQFKSYLD